MAELHILPVAEKGERETAEVLDILRRFTEAAERGEVQEVLVVTIDSDGTLTMGASGNTGATEQVGALERFKATILRLRDGGD